MESKSKNASRISLLGNSNDSSALSFEKLSDHQKERAGSGDDYSFAFETHSALHECLQTTRSKDIWKCPTGKWEKPFAGSGCDNECLIMQIESALGSLGA